MLKSKVKVEQIFNNEVINDCGEILSKKELEQIILLNFKNTELLFDNNIYGEYLGKKYCLFFKNVSYLGNPHPLFKKRIQIPSNFLDVYNKNKTKGIYTFLIGVYKYKNTLLFCDFDTSKYIKNRLHNSSAHVYTIDLLNGYRNGIFKKKDKRNNVITVFNSSNINEFLKLKFGNDDSCGVEVFDTLDDFFASMCKQWFGIECYHEMIENKFTNKYQPEWPGFYLEFKLQQYLNEHHKTNIIKYSQNKKKNDIDLDLFFPKMGIYGDLKAHSSTSTAIQGNDYETIMNIIENQSIYYIVCNHDTVKDSKENYVVTEFWNKIQHKDNLHSYGEKMKYSVKLNSYFILEINKYNKKYLNVFNQGKNSNGKPREPKIMINEKNLNNFLVHIVEF